MTEDLNKTKGLEKSHESILKKINKANKLLSDAPLVHLIKKIKISRFTCFRKSITR